MFLPKSFLKHNKNNLVLKKEKADFSPSYLTHIESRVLIEQYKDFGFDLAFHMKCQPSQSSDQRAED